MSRHALRRAGYAHVNMPDWERSNDRGITSGTAAVRRGRTLRQWVGVVDAFDTRSHSPSGSVGLTQPREATIIKRVAVSRTGSLVLSLSAMQFSLSRLLLAIGTFVVTIGLGKTVQMGMPGTMVAAFGLAGLVLLRREKGLKTSDRLTGFSPRRVAWITASLTVALVPVHFFVSCEMSGRTCFASIILSVITVGLAVADQSGKQKYPILLALVGLIANMMCVH